MDKSQTELNAFFERRSEAVRSKELDQLLAFYAPDIVYYDLVPPLQYIGIAALRDRFADWFTAFESGIGQEIRDLHILASGDVAAAHMLIRTSGTLKSGQTVGYWVRASDSFQRSDNGWLIKHEHISLPVDMRTRSAVIDLVP